MRERIAIDLDNTIFNMAKEIRAIIESHGCEYRSPISYNVYNWGYPPHVANALYEMFQSDTVYNTQLFDEKLPMVLNAIYQDPRYMLFYITERDLSNGRDKIQLNNAGIICDACRMVNFAPKVEILKKYGINLCFDDAPHVVTGCLENDIDVVMISNEDTAYNHHLRSQVEHYPNLMMALKKRGLAK